LIDNSIPPENEEVNCFFRLREDTLEFNFTNNNETLSSRQVTVFWEALENNQEQTLFPSHEINIVTISNVLPTGLVGTFVMTAGIIGLCILKSDSNIYILLQKKHNFIELNYCHFSIVSLTPIEDVGVVLAVGRFLRISVTLLYTRIMFEDMPECDEIISYCKVCTFVEPFKLKGINNIQYLSWDCCHHPLTICDFVGYLLGSARR
jgi:hypothetical protein